MSQNQIKKILGRFPKQTIMVVGDVMLDQFIWGRVSRISPEAPVPVVHVLRETETMGGAANVANNIAALGAGAEVVGAVGGDENGQILRQLLRARGIAFDDRFVVANAGMRV